MEEIKVWFVIRESPCGKIPFAVCLTEQEAAEKHKACRRAYRDGVIVVEGTGHYPWHDPSFHKGVFCPACDA